MGERVGGNGAEGPRKPNPNKIYGPKGGVLIEEVIIKGIKKSNIPTFSQAPDKRIPTTMGAALQDYRDSSPMAGYGTSMGMNIVGKGIMDQLLDFGNFLRNSFGNKSDYSGLGPRMTKWDGNTMSATETRC
ncbi:hypothetical protein OEA66_20130 [Chryseobacterium sp. KC 927]|uniref:Uncharacterized protein n=2 Tax=Chryseobacterium luquanense TaxID=2983766 RepID=A0ABT3Y9C4_9FLAO|nr:hypothetical protein [Chryseobacterium luquanense]